MKSPRIIVLVVVLLGLLATVSYFVYNQRANQDTYNALTPSKTTQNKVESQEATIIPGSNTYTNSKYKYSVQYPQNWYYVEQSKENVGLCSKSGKYDCSYSPQDGMQAEIIISIIDNAQSLSIRQFLENTYRPATTYYPKPANQAIAEMYVDSKVNGREAMRNRAAGDYQTMYISMGSKFLQIIGFINNEEFDNIVNTLTFH